MSREATDMDGPDGLEWLGEEPEDGALEAPDGDEREAQEAREITERYVHGLLAGIPLQPTTIAGQADMHGEIGDALVAAGLVDRAIRDYKQAAELGHGGKWRRRVADAYHAMHLPRQAFQAYKQAIRLDPRDPESHFYMAEFLKTMGRTYLAIGEFKEALRLAPNRAYYALRLGEANLAVSVLNEAVAALRRATRCEPSDAYYRFRLANALLRSGHLGGAVRQLEHAVRLAPCDDYYHALLAMAYRVAGRYNDSMRVLERAIVIRPKNKAYRHLTSETCRDMGLTTLADYHAKAAGRLDLFDADYVDRLKTKFVGRHEEWSRPAWL
jgi:tetratricopeptide (TPR) repeat protein